ncbi:cytosolic factor, phosphatidylinositol/phosphatidylcholine transfer protein [Tilletia horrida]|uniref:Cytosolic factor, phosphatidylinositol/phosphatidylcholine transfer protein n=1 Tax=Tilletia horrida TaxID=155126 RepID=A0AAN6GA20_9BASI|nr:cytosolic factor, phosphatidylinositol/phosphatidylcholine transfer protein [Tilletia horrida]KAK0531810.1 cytosolic factor, phosphatidylinositol/phosphatidylcholine transfer protein [Tilletia horrida]KAK0533047.1 cytosolic factor, phosphatidylinositol/phosphatidylcholine transfer protein [Tilletia horrida]KAK0564789.1 cytosolic factor, phosphatidylinositol/phosphatidylcholine transfer protein [Tilletia horrida]
MSLWRTSSNTSTASKASKASKASRLSKKDRERENGMDLFRQDEHLRGRPGHLDPGQQHQLKRFRQMIEEENLYVPARHDDACLCRFLRARKWSVDDALTMLRAAEKWRKDYGVEELYEKFEYPEKEEVDKYYPQYYHKTDKDGRPLYVEQLGKLDLKALYQVTTAERQLQRLVVEYEKFQRERLPVCSRMHGELVETSCTIMDLKNVGVSQFWKVSTYVQQASNIGQHYYPETMGKFYIVNAPYIFTTVWSVIKGWLDPVTVEKIKILGHNYAEELMQQIPPENLPSTLGGKCNCPGGCSLSDAGPWNTEEGRKILGDVTREAAERIQVEVANAKKEGKTVDTSGTVKGAAVPK